MFHWVPFIVYAGFIFYLSSRPDLAVSGPWAGFDPELLILHIIEYAPLGLLATRAVSRSSRLSDFDNFYFPALIGVFYGLTDEVHQLFVPGRTASPFDLMADAVGVLIGVYLWRSASGKRF
ncbi:MAG: teicoplanin resistance protein VanZ [Methanobacteriota archaeon]|nr:MAG: teicoplanin resistance protein VanZ [Euryarchaeota archaeon]